MAAIFILLRITTSAMRFLHVIVPCCLITKEVKKFYLFKLIIIINFGKFFLKYKFNNIYLQFVADWKDESDSDGCEKYKKKCFINWRGRFYN